MTLAGKVGRGAVVVGGALLRGVAAGLHAVAAAASGLGQPPAPGPGLTPKRREYRP